MSTWRVEHEIVVTIYYTAYQSQKNIERTSKWYVTTDRVSVFIDNVNDLEYNAAQSKSVLTWPLLICLRVHIVYDVARSVTVSRVSACHRPWHHEWWFSTVGSVLLSSVVSFLIHRQSIAAIVFSQAPAHIWVLYCLHIILSFYSCIGLLSRTHIPKWTLIVSIKEEKSPLSSIPEVLLYQSRRQSTPIRAQQCKHFFANQSTTCAMLSDANIMFSRLSILKRQLQHSSQHEASVIQHRSFGIGLRTHRGRWLYRWL